MNQYTICSIDDTHKVADILFQYVLNQHSLCFEGPLGIGKSTIIQCILEKFNQQYQGSPTFGMTNEYIINNNQNSNINLKIVHIDFYQSSSIDILAYDEHIALIEWGSKAPQLVDFFSNIVYVTLEYTANGHRLCTIDTRNCMDTCGVLAL